MAQKIVQIDAFADKPFAGNPAAVCLLDAPRDESWMQLVAREMNVSETAFLSPASDGYNLRWFTPSVEVALCGHATLASAHHLWESGHTKPGDTLKFHTKSGLLTASRRGDLIELDFPARPCAEVPPPPGLLDAFEVTGSFVGKSQYDYLIEVASEDIVRTLIPDQSLLKALSVRGVMVTARSSSSDFDIVSRFFAPGAGVDEDPVTGSAHCTLGPYWAPKLGKSELRAYQASARGGSMLVTVRGDRVLLAGRAITVLRGELCG
ncbi:MAG: PhzF family phenazine biosynthesis protein [candidate division Zixibacteria bacterium]|nr:PhzF family phenazine biosynthesis protein [candidate division Zixibacteria bacterium]